MPRASFPSFFSFIHSSTLTNSFKTPRLCPYFRSTHIHVQNTHASQRSLSKTVRTKAALHINNTSPAPRTSPSKFRSSKNSGFKGQSTWPYIYSSKDQTMAPQLDDYFKQVESLSENFIDRLRRAVAIPSVSADDERRGDVVKVC